MAERESSHKDHEQAAASIEQLGFAIITLSDTRTPETDRSGQFLRKAVEDAGHKVCQYAVVSDESQLIQSEVQSAIADPSIAIVITNGGTGIARRDCAYDTISRLLEKRLDGFGELFRMLSYEEIGAAAMMSRALAGITGDTVIFCLPGSTNAVRLGMEKLILPQATHLSYELRKDQ